MPEDKYLSPMERANKKRTRERILKNIRQSGGFGTGKGNPELVTPGGGLDRVLSGPKGVEDFNAADATKATAAQLRQRYEERGGQKRQKPTTTTTTPKTEPKVVEKKQSVDNMQNKINATDQANFEAARKKLRGNSSFSTMDELMKTLANTNTNLTSGGSKESVEGLTRQQARKDNRKEKRARRRADRGDAVAGSAQYDANFQAEKDLIDKRRAGRKQYLRNFGSQLVRGVNADLPGSQSASSGLSDQNFLANATATAGKAKTGKEAPSELELNAKANRKDMDSQFGQISDSTNQDMKGLLFGGANSFTANMGSKDAKKSEDSFEETEPLAFKLGETETSEDSNPSSFMRKKYMEKRGM
jgi:hypothetical protein